MDFLKSHPPETFAGIFFPLKPAGWRLFDDSSGPRSSDDRLPETIYTGKDLPAQFGFPMFEEEKK